MALKAKLDESKPSRLLMGHVWLQESLSSSNYVGADASQQNKRTFMLWDEYCTEMMSN